VLAARSGAGPEVFAALGESGVKVLADDFALAERGITNKDLSSTVAAAKLDVIVDQLAAGVKTLWH